MCYNLIAFDDIAYTSRTYFRMAVKLACRADPFVNLTDGRQRYVRSVCMKHVLLNFVHTT
jgi:hypothetical protein